MSPSQTAPARIALFAGLALALLAAPLRAEDTPAGGAAPAAPAAKPADTTAETPKNVSVKLVEAGAEPRVSLRYAAAAGTSLEFQTSTTTDVTSPMGAMTFGPIKTTVRVAFSKAVDHATPAAAEIVAASLDAGGNNPFAVQMQAGIEKSKGTKLVGDISDRGIWKTGAMDAEPTAEQEAMQAQMVSLFFPLPTEAVGIGAKWTVTAPITANRVTQTSEITATVTSIRDGRVELTFTEKRSAKNAQMEMMGQKVPITSIEGSGKGTLTIDLGLGGVVAASAKVDTKMVMNMMGNEMENSSATSTTISAKAPEAVTTEAAPESGK